jgi:hypothetical protein
MHTLLEDPYAVPSLSSAQLFKYLSRLKMIPTTVAKKGETHLMLYMPTLYILTAFEINENSDAVRTFPHVYV